MEREGTTSKRESETPTRLASPNMRWNPLGSVPRGRMARERAIDDELETSARLGTGQAEVYCVSRPFQEWGKGFFSTLPAGARDALLTAGVAHFMLVYRDVKTGEMMQFDFGPVDGDVHNRWLALAGGKTMRSSEQGARKTVYAMTKGRVGRHRARSKSSCVPGDVRETKIDKLPENAYLVGTTHLTLNDVRRFNEARDRVYELHINDCRHYLNDLCYYLTREQAVCSKYVKQNVIKRLEEKKGQFWEHHLWLTHAISDLENVENWSKAGRFAGATFMFGMSTRLMPFVPAKRVVTWGSGVIASTSENVPVVREVLSFGGFLLETGRSAVSLLFSSHTNVARTVRNGVEAHFRHENERRNRRTKHMLPIANTKVGLRVSPSSLSLPAVAVTAGSHVRSAVFGSATAARKFVHAPIKRVNSFGRRLNEQISRVANARWPQSISSGSDFV